MALILPLINFYVVSDPRVQEVQFVQFRDVLANSSVYSHRWKSKTYWESKI